MARVFLEICVVFFFEKQVRSGGCFIISLTSTNTCTQHDYEDENLASSWRKRSAQAVNNRFSIFPNKKSARFFMLNAFFYFLLIFPQFQLVTLRVQLSPQVVVDFKQQQHPHFIILVFVRGALKNSARKEKIKIWASEFSWRWTAGWRVGWGWMGLKRKWGGDDFWETALALRVGRQSTRPNKKRKASDKLSEGGCFCERKDSSTQKEKGR